MKRVFSFLFSLTLTVQAVAAPAISSTSGTAGTNNALTINGTGFGTKTRSKLFVWADAQEGSINPHSTLSYSTAWGEFFKVANTTNNPRWGSRTYVSTFDGSTNASKFNIAVPGIGYGSKMYISLWRKISGSYIGNWKWMRIWPSYSGGFPNIYIADPVAESLADRLVYIENDTPITGTNRTYCSGYTNPNTTWRLEEYFFKMNSALGLSDGSFEIRVNGNTACSDSTFRTNTATNSGFWDTVMIQDQKSGTQNSSLVIYKDSMAIDDSWNRVYLGNASTYAASTHLELQPYTSWANTQVTINQRHGTLAGSAYIYVCDNNNDCNSNGFLLGSAGAPAPTLLSVFPVSGPEAGGTPVTITGSNFVSGATIQFGGSNATNVIWVNSTSLTATTPAGTGVVIITVTNPDAQVSALADDFFTYTAPAPTPVTSAICPCR